MQLVCKLPNVLEENIKSKNRVYLLLYHFIYLFAWHDVPLDHQDLIRLDKMSSIDKRIAARYHGHHVGACSCEKKLEIRKEKGNKQGPGCTR